MAPSLLGDHYQSACDDCRIRFAFGLQTEDKMPENIICPNCGFAENKSVNALRQSPDKVKIFPTVSVDRWSAVAFQYPDADIAGIKRVVGLPGETIEVSHGDVYANEKILRKNLETQKRMRILVHDSQFLPMSDVAARWRPSDDQPIWLAYHHWRCCAHRGLRDEDFPVEDNYGFNQTLARNLHPTDDLFLEIDLALAPDSKFGWRFQRDLTVQEYVFDNHLHQLTIDIRDPKSNAPNRERVSLKSYDSNQLRIEFSSFDAQTTVALNDQLIFQLDGTPSKSPPARYPLEISSFESPTEIHRIRLWRDIFFYAESATQSKLKSGSDSYILLGDNVPVSIDSRHWQPSGIKANSIIGVVREK